MPLPFSVAYMPNFNFISTTLHSHNLSKRCFILIFMLSE